MAMNWIHRRICSSRQWAELVRDTVLPWTLRDVDLGENTLEIGPGYGANLRVLVEKTPNRNAVEVDPVMAADLRREYGSRAKVLDGDGAALDLPDEEFHSVVCFTMLQHVPTVHGQDSLFAEARRVLAPGGVFAGCDSTHSVATRVLHIGDTYNPVSPETLRDRLASAGFSDVETEHRDGRVRWRAAAA